MAYRYDSNISSTMVDSQVLVTSTSDLANESSRPPSITPTSAGRSSSEGVPADMPNAIVRRRGSCRLSPEQCTLAENHSEEEASRVRMVQMYDWIDYHRFEEPTEDAMKLVKWDNLSPIERRLALNHAYRNALKELQEHVQHLKANPLIKIPGKDIRLASFLDTEVGDTNSKQMLDIDKLSQIFFLNMQSAEEADHWSHFVTWANKGSANSRGTVEQDAEQLHDLNISDDVLKEGAVYLRETIDEAIEELNNLVDGNRQIKNVHQLGKLKEGCWDICSKIDCEGKFLPSPADGGNENFQKKRKAVLDKWRLSLAFRVKSLSEIRDKIADANDAIREGKATTLKRRRESESYHEKDREDRYRE